MTGVGVGNEICYCELNVIPGGILTIRRPQDVVFNGLSEDVIILINVQKSAKKF